MQTSKTIDLWRGGSQEGKAMHYSMKRGYDLLQEVKPFGREAGRVAASGLAKTTCKSLVAWH